ncbi:MAG: HlyD family secretion protein [Acidobacteriota bacterium]
MTWRAYSSCCLVLTCALAWGCHGAQGDLSTAKKARSTSRQLVVRRGSMSRRVLLTGELRAAGADHIPVPRTPTYQVQIRWMEEDGAAVAEGQKIIEFDNSAFASDLQEKKLAAAKKEKELLQQEAQNAAQEAEKAFQVEQRRGDLEKAKVEASIPKEVRTLREYQEKQLALQRARTEYEKAQEDLWAFRRRSEEELAMRRVELEKGRYEIRLAEESIEALTLYAPRDGILVVAEIPWEGRKLQVGDTVWPGMAVMHIPDLTAMKVEAALTDVDAGKVQAGMRAEVVLDAFPELSFPGTVTGVSPVAQETSPRALRRAFRVTVALDQTEPLRMRPGMSAKVQVQMERIEGILLAPRASLILDEDAPEALLRDGRRVAVRLGPCNPLECVVEEGLEEGARLSAPGSWRQ